MKGKGVVGYIKLQDHEQRKTRAYKEGIGKYYDMKNEAFEDGHYYVCHDGRELRHIRTETKEQDCLFVCYRGCSTAIEHI